MATAEYIGALISLISKSDIRYQGLLASINPEQATIALEKVRSWGSEGRVAAQGRAQEEIPPSDHVYEYIMFRAADVKDLKIDDANPPKPPAPAQPALNDPAILNSSAPQSGPGYGAPAGMYGGMMPAAPYGAGAPAQRSPQPPQTVAPPAASSSASAPAPQPASGASKAARASPAAEAAPKSSADAVLEEMSKLSVSKPAASSSPSSLPAAHGLPAIPRAAAAAAAAAAQSERRNGGGAGASRGAQRERVGGPSMPNREFDFESANAKFQKHGAEGGDEAAGGLLDAIPAPASDSETFYDKSGFFDNISSEIKERYERNPANGGGAGEGGEAASFFDAPAGRGGRGRGAGRGRGRANRMAEEMKNMQTFGDTGASFGGSGGRGRGRGRARGRGRGRANDGSNTAPMRMG